MINRDTQRSRVYAAEFEAFPQMKSGVMSWRETKEYVSKVIDSQYYRFHCGWRRIKVKDGRGCRRALYFPSQKAIALPKWSRTPWVVIHELSHALTHRTVDDSVGHHGTFCTHYANLIAELLSLDDARRLIAMFDKHNVLYQARNLTFTLVAQSKARDKRAKFVELAEKRVNRVINDIRLIGNLSNLSNYDYDPDQIEALINSLRTEVTTLKHTFNQTLNSRRRVRL